MASVCLHIPKRMADTRHDRTASVLAIGTALPPVVVDQATYADYYFRVTKSEHMVDHKLKFKRICEKSGIKKRHTCLDEHILMQNPNLCAFTAPSLDIRRDMVIKEVPILGAQAAAKALEEWGRPRSEITHLVCVTTCGFDLPGPDMQLIKLLGLRLSVKRHLMYYQGCFAGGMVLRLAKDLAENNDGARVLVVCSEITASVFRGPSPDGAHFDNLVGQAIFGDGAAAVVVGASPLAHTAEKPIFAIVSTFQTLIPDSEDGIGGHLVDAGLTFHLRSDVPAIISESIEGILKEALQPIGSSIGSTSDWNSIFWMVHPGGRAILDKMEAKLGLEEAKLRASRRVLWEYGNMSSCTVMFVMDEMRRRSEKEGRGTTGEGLEWGVLMGLGPGLTVDTVVLRSVSIGHGHSQVAA